MTQFRPGLAVFGVCPVLPLCGFPEGRVRIRMRASRFVQVFIRPPTGGVRWFAVTKHDGAWWPWVEIGSNARLSGRTPSAEADGYPVKPAGRWMDDLDGSELASSRF